MHHLRYLLLVSSILPWGCAPSAPPPNVLLISLDACRADRLSAYGYERDTSPFLAELAAGGVRFENAFVNTHGTTSSHTTILSSLYQESHRVKFRVGGGEPPLTAIPESVAMLQEHLRAAGYLTVSVTDGGNVGGKFGFGRGFDLYDDRGGGMESGGRKLLRLLGDGWTADQPAFVFFHTYEIHSPYFPPPEYAERFGATGNDFDTSSENLLRHVHTASELPAADLAFVSDSYDAGIRYTDDLLRELFAELDELGFLDAALVVVTSDHGEELGEHGGFLHRNLLYEELLRVPLIFRGPGVPIGEARDSLASSIDIAPTILDLLSLPIPPAMAGVPLFAADVPPPRLVLAQYGGERYAVRTPRWKLIESPVDEKIELYDLEQDPGETSNLAAENPEMTARLARMLERWRASQRPAADEAPAVVLDQEEIDQLRALGYLGGDG